MGQEFLDRQYAALSVYLAPFFNGFNTTENSLEAISKLEIYPR